MKRLVTSLILALSLLLPMAMVPVVSAQVTNPSGVICTGEAANSPVCGNTATNPISGSEGVIVSVIRILSFAVGVASVIMVILGGLKYITSNGDPNSISSAKNTILYAIIGLVVFGFSQAIIAFVINHL